MVDLVVTTLRARRLELGITQAELGRRLHVHRSSITVLEAGAHTPTLFTLRRWAQALGLDVYVAPVLDRPGRRGVPPSHPCGTVSAAKRHYTRGEPLCAACRAAQRLYDRERKRAKRAEAA